ncbi:esterase-like activity of phytase family protein [Synechococcus sp. Lug-A]|uniref:esterase-like activity of phytase family protein n=1 Tax=Synechococcus sp. Lug-A TaxID=2823740 RepID=UPI0020CDB944|nr:esterase-like activity of phytase family protein [Synechococcus sp. Lug-A]
MESALIAVIPVAPLPLQHPAGPAWVLPCPGEVRWDVLAEVELPREGTDGQPLGGFSAAAMDPEGRSLWLLSDAPAPFLVPLHGAARLGESSGRPPVVGRRLRLTDANGQPFAHPLDGEGLVIKGEDIWIVSEGRRTPEESPRLLRFQRASGRLLEAWDLPEAWQAAPGRGLGSNQGPEALTLLPPSPLAAGGSGLPPSLLLAAERPLLQDPEGALRLLRFGPVARSLASNASPATPVSAAPAAPAASTTPETPALKPAIFPAGRLAVALEGPQWGLTELLAPPRSGLLLGLVRGFAAPNRWWARLVAFPLPSNRPAGEDVPPLTPVRQWDLLAAGLSPDNWEALAVGPALADGRPTLLLASDDNFNVMQANRIARIAPRCPARP